MPAVSLRSKRLLSLNNIECHTESRWMSQDSGPNPGSLISQTTYASQRSFTCCEACPSESSPADVVAVFRNTRIMEGGNKMEGSQRMLTLPISLFFLRLFLDAASSQHYLKYYYFHFVFSRAVPLFCLGPAYPMQLWTLPRKQSIRVSLPSTEHIYMSSVYSRCV